VPVLVGLPQGGRHELMLLAFAACLRRAGVNAIHLGADVPLDDWKTVASEVGARLLDERVSQAAAAMSRDLRAGAA
jgi:methanogenic corrinoid protein MtbC1